MYSGVATYVDLKDEGRVYYYYDNELHDSYDKAMKHLFRTEIPELLDEFEIDFDLPDSFRKKIEELNEKNKEDGTYCLKCYFRNFDVDEVEFEDLFETGCDGFRVSYTIIKYNMPKRPREDNTEELESNKRQK
jgi:hypothetical protein